MVQIEQENSFQKFLALAYDVQTAYNDGTIHLHQLVFKKWTIRVME